MPRLDLLTANDAGSGYPESYYASVTPTLPPFPPLEDDARADLCIVGGGYTGLSAALHAARAGMRVVLVEAQRVGFGASGRNGGQVIAGQRLDQIALEQIVGPEDAARLWELSLASVALLRALVAEGGIDCDFQPGWLHAETTEKGAAETAAYVEHLATRYGYGEVTALDRAGVEALVASRAYAGGMLDEGSGHLNPLAYALGLARMADKAGAAIHEGSRAIEVAPGRVVTARGTVRAEHVLLACNGYLGGLHGPTAARVMPINNFIAATEPLPEGAALSRRICVSDSNFVVNYFRTSADGRLLFGGGESYGFRFPRDIAAKVRRPMARIFPQHAGARITHAWGGTLAITKTRMPLFSRPEPGIWTASGYSGHGVAMATLGGKMIVDAIAGETDPFDLMARVPVPVLPGGAALRWPLLVTAMTWFALRDRLGV